MGTDTQDDQAAANVLMTMASAIRQLVDSGFEHSSVVDAIVTRDMSKLRTL